MALPSAARATAQSCSTAAGDTPVRVHLRVHCRRPAPRACAASCTALRRPPAQTTTRGRPAQVPARCSKCSQPPRALGAAHQHSECNAKFDIVLFETPWRTLLPVVFKFAHWCTFSPYRVQRKVRGYTSPRSLIGHLLSAAVKLNTGVNLRIDLLWRRLLAHGILELWPNSATELQPRYPLRAPNGHGCARTVSVGGREKGK